MNSPLTEEVRERLRRAVIRLCPRWMVDDRDDLVQIVRHEAAPERSDVPMG